MRSTWMQATDGGSPSMSLRRGVESSLLLRHDNAKRTHERRQRLRSLFKSAQANARLSSRYSEEEKDEDAPAPAARAPSTGASGFLLAAVAASERARATASIRRGESNDSALSAIDDEAGG